MCGYCDSFNGQAASDTGRGYAFGAQDYGADTRDTFRAVRFGQFWALMCRLALCETDSYRMGGRPPIGDAYRQWTDNGEYFRWESASGVWAIVPAFPDSSDGRITIVPVPGVHTHYGAEKARNTGEVYYRRYPAA